MNRIHCPLALPHFRLFSILGRKQILAGVAPILALIIIALPGTAKSQSGTWDGGGGDQLLSTEQNFDDDTDLVSGAQALTFSGILNVGPIHDLGAGFVINGINFTNDGSVGTMDQSFNLTANSATDTFVLGGDIVTTATTTGTLTDIIDVDLILNANRNIQVFQGHNLTISGDISEDGGGPYTINVGPGNNVNKGLLTLSGNNSFSILNIQREGNVRVETAASLGNQLLMGDDSFLGIAAGLNLNPTNGIIIQNNARTKIIQLNEAATSTAEISSSITINTSGTLNNRRLQFDVAADNTLTVSGIISSGNTNTQKIVRKVNTGTLVLTQANTFDGQLQANAGTLRLGNSLAAQNATLTNNGGNIVFDNTVGPNFTVGALNGGSDLSLLDDLANPINLTIGGHGANRTYAGDLSGAGATVTFNGNAGISQGLNGNNTYTGATQVNSGRLDLGGTNTSAVTVAGGATLGGEGSTDQGITFSANSILGINNKTSAAALAVTGGSTLDTSGGNIDIILNAGRGTTAQVVNLLDYTAGTWTGNTGNFNVFSRDSIIDVAQIIQLNIAASEDHQWDNAPTGNGIWDVDTSQNWTSSDDRFITNDSVTFTDTAAGTVTLDESNGAIVATDVTFTNTAGNDYTLAQTTAETLTVDGTLLVQGSGNVTIDTGLEITGTNLDTTGSSGDITLNGAITGATEIDHAGTGTLALNNAANSQTGGVTVRTGATLDLASAAARGSAGNVITVEDGGTILTRSVQNTRNNSVIQIIGTGVNGLGALRQVAGGNTDYREDLALTGSATISVEAGRFDLREVQFVNPGTVLTKTGANQLRIDRNLNDANAANLTGIIINQGTVHLNNANAGTGNQTWTINAGNLLLPGARTVNGNIIQNGGMIDIDGDNATSTFNGTITVNGDSIWEVDTNGGLVSTMAIASTLSGAGNITTEETGIIDFLATSDTSGYTGTLNQVSAGTVQINSAQTLNSIAASNTGATLSLQGNTLTTGDAGSTQYLGTITGVGGAIIKQGTGTFGVSDLSTYTGATTVNGGRFDLLASGTSAFVSDITVADGQSIGGEGTSTGALTFGTTGSASLFIDPTTTGELTVGNLDISNGVDVFFDLAPTLGGLIDVITYTGTLTDNLGVNSGDLTLDPAALAQLGTRLGAGDFSDTGGTIQLNTGVDSNTWNPAFAGNANTGNWGEGVGGDNNWVGSVDTEFFNNDAVIFNDDGVGDQPTVTLTSSVIANQINFANTAGAYVIQAGGSETITATNGIFVDAASTSNVTINAEITGNTLIDKLGNAVLILSGDNSSLTGNINIREDGLRITNANALGDGTGTITMSDEGDNPFLDIEIVGASAFDIQNDFVISNTGNEKDILYIVGGTGNSGTISGNIAIDETAARDFRVTVAGGETLNFTGIISGVGSFQRGDNTNAGTGVVNLNNATNSFTGYLGIGAGTTVIASLADAGVASHAGAGSEIRFGYNARTGTLSYTGGAVNTDRQVRIGQRNNGNNRAGGGILQNNGTGAMIFRNAVFNLDGIGTDVQLDGVNLTLGGSYNGDDNEILGVIQDNGPVEDPSDATDEWVSITVDTAGTWKLSGLNTYEGATTVTNGTLKAGSTAAFGINSDTTVSSPGVLLLDGFSNTIGALNGDGTVTGDDDSASTPTLTVGGGDRTGTFSGVLQDGAGGGSLSLTKTGAGTQTLSGTNTYTGATTVSNGTLQAGSTSAFGTNSNTTVSSPGILLLDGNSNTIGSLNGDGTVTGDADSATAATLTIGGGDGSGTFSGIIQDGAGGGPLSVTKTGTGTQTLSGANTYTGTTTVSTGTLLIDGSTASGSVVSVENTSILGGGGTINDAVTIGATASHTAGTTTGADVQTINGNLTYDSGATLTWNLISNSAGPVSGDQFDQFSLTGAGGDLTFNGTLNLMLDFGGTVDLNQSFWNASLNEWLIWDTGADETGLLPSSIVITNNIDPAFNGSFTLNAGSFHGTGDGNGIWLVQTSVIPEPGTFALMSLGLGGFGWFVRRRKKGKSQS